MINLVFAINIKGILEDGTEVTNVTGILIDNKRVYKLSDNTILSGQKKIKDFLFATFTVPAAVLPFIMSKVYE